MPGGLEVCMHVKLKFLAGWGEGVFTDFPLLFLSEIFF